MTKSGQPPKSFTTDTRVVRKNRSAGVSPASEPRQLLLGQHDLCRLEAGDTFFLTTTEYTEMHGEPVVIADFGLRIVLMEKVFINSKSEIRNRQSAIKGPSVSLW